MLTAAVGGSPGPTSEVRRGSGGEDAGGGVGRRGVSADLREGEVGDGAESSPGVGKLDPSGEGRIRRESIAGNIKDGLTEDFTFVFVQKGQ